jgi:hypothetical protein
MEAAAASGSDHFGMEGDRWWYRGASGQIEGSRDLTTLPAAIGTLADITSLIVRKSAVAALPPEIGRLRNLRKLYVSETALTRLPDEIASLRNLTELSLSRNRVLSLPDAIGELPELATIRVEDNNLQQLPAGLESLTKLEWLNASNNQIDVLPSLRITALITLQLGHNRLRRLPADFGALANLSSLTLEHNEIEALPASMGDLRSLTQLNASHNRLVALPIELARLTQLSYLNVSHNQLYEWPAALCELPNLRTVDLQGNLVTELPQEITGLRALRELYLYPRQPTPLPIDRHLKYWDVFISHASEDRESVAAPLADILVRSGLRVWLDQQEIKLGDSIRGKIDEGLSRSRFGVVVLSPAFLRKSWTQQELGGLMSIEEQGTKVILPVWHQLTRSELARQSPLLADRAAANTDAGLSAVGSQIVDVVLYRRPDSPPPLFPSLTQRFARLIAEDDAEAVADFLLRHPSIVSARLGSFFGHSDRVRRETQAGPPLLSATIRHGSSLSSSVCFLSLETSHGSHVAENGETVPDLQHALDRMRTLLDRDGARPDVPLESDEAIIVRSRRFELRDADRRWLREHQQALRADGIQVRSYDWLLDAAAVTMNDAGV